MSLSTGWKVELGVGDPEAIDNVGIYDTSTYADGQLAGEWVRGTGDDAGEWNPDVGGLSLSVNDLDDGGTNRRAEMLGATYPTDVSVSDGTITVTVTVVAAFANTGFVLLAIDPPDSGLSVFTPGELCTILWHGEGDVVYGSDDPFGYLVDATAFCESINTKRGRDRFTSRFRTGSCTLVFDDTSGVFTPPAGIAPPLGFLPLRPGRTVRVSYKGANVFSGFIDSLDSRTPRSGNVLSVIRCVDAFAGYNRNDPPAVTDEGAGDTTPERMMRLLDRFIGPGEYTFQFFGEPFATMQATTMGQNLLSELQVTADSEGGGCYIDVHGNVAATAFTYFPDKVAGPPDWTVGGASPIKIWSSDSDWEMIRIINEAHMSRSGGTEQIRFNTDSAAAFGRRTFTRLDLNNDSDDQVAVLAQNLVDFAGEDRQRLTELRFLPEPDTDAAVMAVTADFGDVFVVTIETIWGWSYTVKTALFGIEHSVTPERWIATFRTDDTLFDRQEFAFQRASFNNDAFS